MKEIACKKNHRDLAFHHVLGMIVSRNILPGELLHETTVAEKTGSSRTPVREAVIRLMQCGMLEQVPGKRGYYVPKLTIEDMREVFIARECLERKMTSLCAEHASKSDIDYLENANNEEKKAVACLASPHQEKEHELEDGNARFHLGLARISRNRYLKNHYTMIYWRSRLYYHHILNDPIFKAESFHKRFAGHFRPGEREKNALQEHAKIIQAIHQRDPKAAEEAVSTHFYNTTAYFVAFKFPEIFDYAATSKKDAL